MLFFSLGETMNVLILCAGYGTRLAPLTDRVPKPLVKIADKTGLEIQLERCQNVAYKNMCINTHHLAEALHEFATEIPINKVFYEPEILGTGGPLRRMYNENYQDDLLVINCDIYHDFDLADFVAQAQGSHYSLLLIDNEKYNSVEVSGDSITGISKVFGTQEYDQTLTFSGVSWYSKEALAEIKEEHFSIVSFWKTEALKNKLGRAVVSQGNTWIDIGSPEGLYAASFDRIKHSGKELENGSIIGENVSISQEVSVMNSIVLDNTTLSEKSYSNAIVGEGIEWQL